MLFHSTDAGVSWHRIETGTEATLTDAILLHDGRVLLAGYSGSLLTLDPDEAEARLIQLEHRMGISSLLQLASGNLLLLGTGGSLHLPLGRLSEDAPKQ